MTSMAEKVLGNQTQSAGHNEPSSLKHNGPTGSTPGPWRLKFTHPTPDYEYPYMTLNAGDGCENGFHMSGIISEEDARLIAAAPDMLAALQECERVLGIRRDFVPLGPALVLAPTIRAAIAKATGAA